MSKDTETTFPNVGTIPTKGTLDSPGREFITARTQTVDGHQETEVHVYWHIPEDPAEPPYLMVEVDDFTGLPMKVMVNEGTIYNTSTDIEVKS